MNRIWFSARSLVTNSWLMRITLLIFFLFAVGFLFYGMAAPMIMFFGCVLAGIAYTSLCMLGSERRWLVPGMNETCAGVAIALWATSSAVSTVLVATMHGFFPECIGCVSLALAFALWVGMLEKSALAILILFYVVPVLAVSARETVSATGDAYLAFPWSVRFFVGLMMIGASIAMIARYWYLNSSQTSPSRGWKARTVAAKHEPVTWDTFRAAVYAGVILIVSLTFGVVAPAMKQQSFAAWGSDLGSSAMQCGIAFLIIGAMYALWRGLIQFFSTTSHSLTDVGNLMFGGGGVNKWKSLPWIMAIVLVASFAATRLYESSATDQYIHPKIGFALILTPFVFSAFVLHGANAMFARLWLVGLSQSRNTTARVLFLAVVARALPFVLIVFALVMTLSMQTTTGLVPTLLASIILFPVGGIILWVIARTFSWLAKHTAFAVILYLVFMGIVIVFVASGTGEILGALARCERQFGAAACIVTATVASTAIWFVCLWDASRAIANSASFMEADSTVFMPAV